MNPLTDLEGLNKYNTAFDADNFTLLLFRFAINLLVTGLIIRLMYYPRTKRRDYFFSFIVTSTTIFMLLFMLDTVKLQVGFALGLFAIFGILRYRTDTMPIREMTYLFLIIGISVINALAKNISYIELGLTNAIFISVSWLMESNRVLKHISSKMVVYEKIDLIVPERRPDLIADLKVRTGLDITNIEIGSIDFLKDTTSIKVYYVSNEVNTADVSRKLWDSDTSIN
jgi:hypothetical protein